MLRHLRDAPNHARARCIAESLCAGLGAADLAEAGNFLMRAAELGDPDAMAAVAYGSALDDTAAGMRHLPATRALAPAYMRQALAAGSPIAMMQLTTELCTPENPVIAVPFHRDFPVEEQLAWFHAIQPMLQSQNLGDVHRRCADRLTPEALSAAVARGRALHAQHYAGRRDLPTSLVMDWGRTRASLGVFPLHDDDPRWKDFPECTG